MSKINIVLDATMLSTFRSCPCKFNYRFNQNKVTVVKAKPLDKGSLMHIGKEHYFLSLQKGDKFEQALDAGLVATRVALATDSDLNPEEGNRVLEVLEEHCRYWQIADKGFEIVAVEKPFSYVLFEDDNFRIVMIGKIDLLISDNVYTNLPVDFKTYDRDFPVHRMTDQFTNYATAMDSNYLIVDRIGFQTSIPPAKKFKRVPLSYDPLFKAQWRDDVIKWTMQYYDCTQSGDYPMNTTSCDKYNRLCEYHAVCDTSGEDNKTYKLMTDFKTDTPWDVSKVLALKD